MREDHFQPAALKTYRGAHPRGLIPCQAPQRPAHRLLPAAASNGTGEGEDTAASAALQQAAARSHSLLGILLMAFLGVLILNVMPCVLPVIAVKYRGVVQQSPEAPRGVRRRGLTCGAAAVRARLAAHYHLKPLPSVRTIGRILARNGLTNGRTGCDEDRHQA